MGRFSSLGRWVCLVATCLAVPVSALGGGDTPQALSGVRVVDAEAVAALAGKDARLVDTRALHDFLVGHLPDALHVDYKERSVRDIGFDPKDDDVPAFLGRLGKFVGMDRPLVFYCNGPACWKSYKAAAVASKAGYRQVYWFRGGLSEWKQKGKPVVGE